MTEVTQRFTVDISTSVYDQSEIAVEGFNPDEIDLVVTEYLMMEYGLRELDVKVRLEERWASLAEEIYDARLEGPI